MADRRRRLWASACRSCPMTTASRSIRPRHRSRSCCPNPRSMRIGRNRAAMHRNRWAIRRSAGRAARFGGQHRRRHQQAPARFVAGDRRRSPYRRRDRCRRDAFAADTGAQLWRTAIGSTGKDIEESLFGGGTGIDGKVVYATSGAGDVAALDVADRTVIWTVKPGGPLRGAPTIAYGNVYVMSQDNQILALKAANGAVLMAGAASLEAGACSAPPRRPRGRARSSPASRRASSTPIATRMAATCGRTRWRAPAISTSVSTLSDIDADPVIDRGRVFAVGQGGRMVALRTRHRPAHAGKSTSPASRRLGSRANGSMR